MACKECGGNGGHHKPGCGMSPAVLQINNKDCTLFHNVTIPAIMGDETENPPANGLYKNVLLYYEASGNAYFYSSDGIPTKLTYATTDYNALTNKPTINGVTLEGNQSSDSLGLSITVDSELSETSTNPVQNAAIYAAIGNAQEGSLVRGKIFTVTVSQDEGDLFSACRGYTASSENVTFVADLYGGKINVTDGNGDTVTAETFASLPLSTLLNSTFHFVIPAVNVSSVDTETGQTSTVYTTYPVDFYAKAVTVQDGGESSSGIPTIEVSGAHTLLMDCVNTSPLAWNLSSTDLETATAEYQLSITLRGTS